MRRSERLRKKRLRQENGTVFNIKPLKKRSLKESSQDEVIDWAEWVAATDTRNYLMDDSFLDILRNKSAAVIKANPTYSKEIGKVMKRNTDNRGFVPSLMNLGNKFEKKVFDLLIQELGKENVKDILGNQSARSSAKYRETIQAMNDGIPCIFQGILRNYRNKTYGVADILIRSDWINKFLDVNALKPEEIHASGVKLNNPEKNSRKFRRSKNKNVRYHYVVIDVKYKTLPLRADGIHLRNDANMKAYKSQLWIYNDALSEIQGYCPPYSFILGSKWKYTSGKETFEGTSCFDRLGRIDFGNLDKEYIEKTRKAVEWLNEVRKEGDKWDLSRYPLPRDELYPNMCNRHDYPYRDLKRKFAEVNDDLTLIWRVGPKQRRIANSNGIYKWTDRNCNSQTLGVNGEVYTKVIDRILEANHSEGRNIYPKYVSHNFSDWKNLEQRDIELFVDFETTCSVFNEMEDITSNDVSSLIFLIGAGYVDPKTKEWVFNEFIVDTINEQEEERICLEFVSFVEDLKKKFKVVDSLPLFHFSHAEPSSWRRACERFSEEEIELEWVDLMKVFLLEPIGVKGCLSYNLKTLAKNFYKHGYISTVWSEEGECVDGADAAVGAYRANLECQNSSFADHPVVQDIIKYNEVDCKVLMEILFYLRENHVDYESSLEL